MSLSVLRKFKRVTESCGAFQWSSFWCPESSQMLDNRNCFDVSKTFCDLKNNKTLFNWQHSSVCNNQAPLGPFSSRLCCGSAQINSSYHCLYLIETSPRWSHISGRAVLHSSMGAWSKNFILRTDLWLYLGKLPYTLWPISCAWNRHFPEKGLFPSQLCHLGNVVAITTLSHTPVTMKTDQTHRTQ